MVPSSGDGSSARARSDQRSISCVHTDVILAIFKLFGWFLINPMSVDTDCFDLPHQTAVLVL